MGNAAMWVNGAEAIAMKLKESVDVDCRKAESAGPWIKLGMMLSGQKKNQDFRINHLLQKGKKTFFLQF